MLGILWMPDLVNLNFLCGENFWISINLLELCYTTWKQLDPFKSCFYDLLGGSGTVPILGLSAPTSKAGLSWVLYIMHHKIWIIMSFFSPAGEDRHHSQPCVPGTVPLFLWHDSHDFFYMILSPGLVSSHSLLPILCWTVRGSATHLWVSLWAAILSLMFCTTGSGCSSLPGLSSISSTQQVCWTLLQDQNWKLSLGGKLGNCRAHITCFLSLRCHRLFLSYLPCLENHWFMHFICFSLFQVEE